MKICVWPDGFWCERAELEEALQGRSDDFATLDAGELLDEDIDELVAAYLK